MLNERKEYEEYSSDETSRRLALRRLKKNLTGTARALETVARFYLFHGNEKDLSVTKTPPEDPMSVESDLISWTDSWLMDYAERILEDKTKNKRKKKNETDSAEDATGTDPLEKLKERIQISGAAWKDTNPWEHHKKSSHNTFNKIHYQTVIASALDHGPLRVYALIEKEDLFDSLVDEDGADSKRPIASQRDYLLKLTAAYLLHNPLHQNSVFMAEANLLNWCSKQNPDEKSYFIMEDNVPTELIRKLDLPGSENYVKYSACKRWLDNFALLDITEEGALEKWVKDPANSGKAYYLDNGSGAVLEKHIVGSSEEKKTRKKNAGKKTGKKKKTKKDD